MVNGMSIAIIECANIYSILYLYGWRARSALAPGAGAPAPLASGGSQAQAPEAPTRPPISCPLMGRLEFSGWLKVSTLTGWVLGWVLTAKTVPITGC